MVEKSAARGCQFDTARAAVHQRDPDLIFEVAHLTAERRLGGMQSLLGRDRQASLFGDRDEIAKMPELDGGLPYLQGMPLSLQSLFLRRQGRLHAQQHQAWDHSAASEPRQSFRLAMLCR